MTENKKYWRGIEEQSNPELTEKLAQNEFANDISSADFLGNDEVAESETSRRDFLKFMGFSTAAATLAACEAPIVESIPYVVKPDSLTPGLPSFYATSMFDGTDYASILVKTREGRPIKVEPNSEAPFNNVTNARTQASVLSLYDGARLRGPKVGGQASSWNDALGAARELLTENSVLLTSSVISPALKTAIAKLGLRHISVDPVSVSNRLDVYEGFAGKRGLPTVDLENASTVFAVGADFLGDWGGQNLMATYAERRKPSEGMLKHIQAEAGLTLSGSNADVRIKARVSEYESILAHVYNKVASVAGLITLNSPALREDISQSVDMAAGELLAAGSSAVVLNGLNTKNAERLALAINLALKSKAFNTSTFVYTSNGNDESLSTFLSDVKAGTVDAVVTLGVNPTYQMPTVDLNGLSIISIADREDETASAANIALPISHYLESWSDFSAVDGHYAVGQPTISPLFDSKSAVEILNALAGGSESAKSLIKESAASNAGSTSWNGLLHDGFTRTTVSEVSMNGSMDAGMFDISGIKVMKPQSGLEFYTYTKTGMGAGENANNPWTYELPDPISRLSWDNYIVMSAADAVELGIEVAPESNGAMTGNTLNITVDGNSLENVPVWIQPGQTKGTLGLAVGFGRTAVGKVGNNVGVNAYKLLLSSQSVSADVSASSSEIEHGFASVQLAHTMMGRKIVNEITLPTFMDVSHDKWNEKPTYETYKGPLSSFEANLWDDHDHETSHMWNMSIDLNSCTGCGACVVACSLENNVPVVGKDEVRRHRDMHWLRIDRYYSSEMTPELAEENDIGAIEKFAKMEVPSESPDVVFQPVMCQHCNHAPCETVCPVGATVHSREGLNHMAYNRCIGTRYCANNCPYKVRRFNWFNYKGNEKFADVNPSQDDYGRMVLNPDVTVRARGVIEKCSLCIQRIQLGKLEAKKDSRMLTDGEFTTACAQACGSNAIVFGDVNNPKSEVSHLKQEGRAYHLLEEVGTQPSVFYQTKVRNRA
ncbi:MAG: quinol:cytochrome C oxidoreductase [Flavobacteriales bacterium]|nr:quinol:cytochrome C oxidoreductase [Flavobacteriales bacterium]